MQCACAFASVRTSMPAWMHVGASVWKSQVCVRARLCTETGMDVRTRPNNPAFHSESPGQGRWAAMQGHSIWQNPNRELPNRPGRERGARGRQSVRLAGSVTRYRYMNIWSSEYMLVSANQAVIGGAANTEYGT